MKEFPPRPTFRTFYDWFLAQALVSALFLAKSGRFVLGCASAVLIGRRKRFFCGGTAAQRSFQLRAFPHNTGAVFAVLEKDFPSLTGIDKKTGNLLYAAASPPRFWEVTRNLFYEKRFL